LGGCERRLPLLGSTKPHGVNVSYGVFTDITGYCDRAASGHRRGYYALFTDSILHTIAKQLALWNEQVVSESAANGHLVGLRTRQ
jgi:hypothetical protein